MSDTPKTLKNRRPWILLIAVATMLVATAGIGMFVHHWKEKSKVTHCIMNLRNYNSGIAGATCISNEPSETWSEPEAVIGLLQEKFEMDLPTCPDGGTYSLIYDPDSPYLPRLVCSKEKSHGHGFSNR